MRSRSDEEIEVAAAARGPRACRTCKQVKGPDEYPRDHGRRDGRGTLCLTCAAAATSYYNSIADPEDLRLRKAASYQKNYGTTTRSYKLRTTFGISLAEYQEMFESQGGVCAICEKPEWVKRVNHADQVRELCVDHDHETGVVRQLLCAACNKALGYFKDNPDLMRRAALYVENHRSIQQRDDPPA